MERCFITTKNLIETKIKYLYYFVFLTILYNTIYIKESLPYYLQILLTYIIPISQVLLLVFGGLLLYQDYKINKEKSVLRLPYIKWILLYTLYLCVLTIFQGTIFNTYNNAFFIVHSILFFCIMLIFVDRFNWMETMVKVALLIVIILSAFSIATFIIFFITHTNLINGVRNIGLRNFYLSVAPQSSRLIGLMQNPNTYAYLLLYSFYIYVFLIIYFKTSKLKYVFSILLLFNIFNLVLTASRGALLSFLISLVFFACSILILLRKTQHEHYYVLKIIFISLAILLIIFLIYVFSFNSELAITTREFIINDLLRIKWLKTGSGRTNNWKVALSMDKSKYIFGVNDQHMYNRMAELLPKRSSSFIHNNGRYHNIYITLIVNYGIFALLGFIYFIIYSVTDFVKGYFISSFRRKRFILIFISQFLAILISGIFEQLPIFNLSPHSLLFMFCWSSLFVISNRNR